MKKKIIIIGGGFGGLAAACRMAAHGHNVELFEKRDKLGGRAYVYEINGFKFDGGPAVITAPFMIDDIFTAAGKNREDYFQMIPVAPFYRIFENSGHYFDYNSDTQFILDQIDRWNPADKDGYQRFIQASRLIFEKGFQELALKPFLKFSDLLKVVPDLVRLQSYRTVYGFVSQFVKNDFLRRALSFHPMLIGANPFRSTSIYAMIHYLERKWGVYYSIGGIGSIINAFAQLFTDLGGKYHLNTEVVEILAENHRISGVRLADGSTHQADAVICNAEVAYSYLNLLPANARRTNSERRYKHMRYSNSLFVIYFGTRRRYTESHLAHHNLILGKRYKGLFDDIFNKKILADDLTLQLHAPSLTDPSMAPEGCESFYVLSAVPNLSSGIDWTRAARPYRDRIMEFLEENYLPDLRANIVAEHYIDPLHFQNTLNSYQGAAFSIQPTLTQSGWFRPHNRSEDFNNLYFVGSGTHPGAGLPGVLSSAIIVENLIEST